MCLDSKTFRMKISKTINFDGKGERRRAKDVTRKRETETNKEVKERRMAAQKE